MVQKESLEQQTGAAGFVTVAEELCSGVATVSSRCGLSFLGGGLSRFWGLLWLLG